MKPNAAGLRTGCITGRESAALLWRAREMKMEFIYMKQPLKIPAYEEILQKAGVSGSAVAYIGDDLTDQGGFRVVEDQGGVSIAVGDRVRGQYRVDDSAAVRRWLRGIAALQDSQRG